MKARWLLCAFALLTLGCASVPQNPPNVFFPQDFWEEPAISNREARFAQNWEAALLHADVRSSLKARLMLGPGKGYRMIDGNELLALSYTKLALVRHTNAGDQNPDGSWNPGCPGSFFQNKFGVYDRIQSLRPDVAVVEIHTGDNTGCSPATSLLERWVIIQARSLNRQDPQLLLDFYKFWDVFKYNQETKSWDLKAHTVEERRAAIHTAACEGWTWQLGPTTPFVFLYQNGKSVRHGTTYALFVGTLPSVFEGHPDEETAWEGYIQHYFGLPQGGPERDAERRRQLTRTEQAAADVLARGILKDLGLL